MNAMARRLDRPSSWLPAFAGMTSSTQRRVVARPGVAARPVKGHAQRPVETVAGRPAAALFEGEAGKQALGRSGRRPLRRRSDLGWREGPAPQPELVHPALVILILGEEEIPADHHLRSERPTADL